jgi:hypothetical protein
MKTMHGSIKHCEDKSYHPALDGIPTLESQLAKIFTSASILLQPDDPVRLNIPTDPKVMFVGALDPDTLTHSRYTIHRK